MLTLSFIKSDFEGYTRAKYKDILDCPIARMVKRAFPGKMVFVGGTYLAIGDENYNIEDGKLGNLLIPTSIKLLEYKEYYDNNEFAELVPKLVNIDCDLVPTNADVEIKETASKPIITATVEANAFGETPFIPQN